MNASRNAVICLLTVLIVGGCAAFKPTIQQYRTDFNYHQPTDQIGNWFVTPRIVADESQDEDNSETESPVRIAFESYYAFQGENPPRHDLVPELDVASIALLVKGTPDTIPVTVSHLPATFETEAGHYLKGPGFEVASDGPVPDSLELELRYMLQTPHPRRPSETIRERVTHGLETGYFGNYRIWAAEENPNPFSPTTSMRYHLPDTALVQILVYNVEGKLVDTLVNDMMPPGEHEIVWDAGEVDTGVYFWKLILNGVDAGMKKMLLLK